MPKNENDFGELVYRLRKQKGLTYQDVVDKLDNPNIKEKNIQDWERNMELPELGVIYQLAEIYEIAPDKILYAKQMTLQSGIQGINKRIIKALSVFLGISIYGSIWLFRIALTAILVFSVIWFVVLMKSKGLL